MLVYDETYTRGASAYTERKQKTEESAPPQFAYINDVAILKSDVARKENGAFAVLSWRHSRNASSGLPPLLFRAAECWQEIPVSLM